MLRILLLSFYYSPDLCAGSFRCSALVEHLAKYDLDIDVVTTAPNRYSTFTAAAPALEKNGRVTIHRVELPSHRSGMLDQARSFLSYYRAARKIASTNKYNMIFATSSRLFTAFLGANLANKYKIPLYLDIRDIFVDTIKDVLSKKISWFFHPVFNAVEKYTFGSARRINLVSEGFHSYFHDRYPKVSYRFFTNGIDKEFLASSVSTPASKLSAVDHLRVLYAGNIGEGQGLHKIIPGLARQLTGRAVFRIIGDGGRKSALKTASAEYDNVEIIDPVSRHQLIDEYQNADILFLHLNDYPAFKKVLPSKVFEYAAIGKPILAGVSGYAAEFITKEVVNSAVFHPGDVNAALAGLDALDISINPRADFVAKYTRDSIMHNMASDIMELSQNG